MKKNNYFYEFDVPQFIETIELSKKRRARYYKAGSKIPKRYKGDSFMFDKNGILCEEKTGVKIIKNSRSVGTPNIMKINGQYFWTGANPHLRRKIKREMSDYFTEYIKHVPQVHKSQYPIGVRIDLYDVIDGGSDLDNFIFIYRKVIQDVLTGKDLDIKPVIIDDNKEYIRDIPSRFYPIDEHENRKLNIQIYSL